MSNVLFFHNGTASHKWRIDGVAERANRDTDHAIYVTGWNNWNDNVVDADLVVFQLIAAKESLEVCRKQGAKIILEADDAWIDSQKVKRKNLDDPQGEHKELIIHTLRNVDALTVTNEVLKENYARYTDKPIYVVPNYIDLGWYGDDKLNIERTTDEIRIGWFGSHGHLEDLEMVIPALNEILDKYPNVKFIYCGHGGMSGGLATEAGWGEDWFRAIPRDRREFYRGVNEEYWPMKHRFLDLDIGIAPLIDDYFNECKTPIKWMEYGSLSTPAVCSPTLYKDVITHGDDGLIARNSKEWVKLLSDLIEDKEFRTQLGKNAYTTVTTKHNLEDHWEDLVSVYEKVILG